MDNSLTDQCLACHKEVADTSPSHPHQSMGCATCHLGNGLAKEKGIAHAGMVRNPSDLYWAGKTCGKNGCHPDLTNHVKNSLMNSNAGLVQSTFYQWLESDSLDNIHADIRGISDTSLAGSHLRKLCSGCHINKAENDFDGEIGQRGGGCNDCHLQRKAGKNHPQFTLRMEIAVCEKCHNRSNRTALSYQGKFESEGYGTPFKAGNPSGQTLSGERYYNSLPADRHFELGLVCIDCHIMEDVMGDGQRYAHLEEAVYAACRSCHVPVFARPDRESTVWKLLRLNPNLRTSADSLFGLARDSAFYPNLIRENGQNKLITKLDGRSHPVPSPAPACSQEMHNRLACQACHSAYTPQCYGCHEVYNPAMRQMDKIAMKETPGHWKEFRSFLRYEDPALGLDQRGQVMPMAPGCQVFLTELDRSEQIKTQKTWLTMAGFDPHITRKAVPDCIECHSNPKRLGLGEGELMVENGQMAFIPSYNSEASGLGSVPPEAMLDLQGNALQQMSRIGERPFNRDELVRIYRVSYCLTCHDRYEDRVYQNWPESLRLFGQGHCPEGKK